MKIKLIALDLDGTLLNESKELSKANLEYLLHCIHQGIWVVPATGRSLDGIPEEVKSIPGVRYVITTNGAVVVDLQKNEIISSSLLGWEQTEEILTLADSYKVMYDPYINGRGITEPRFMDHMEEYSLEKEIIKIVRATRDVCPDIKRYVRESRLPVEKINLFFPDKEEKSRFRQAINNRKDVLITSSLPLNLEINAIGATKGDGLKKLAEHLHIPMGATMAMGDGENDISMIQCAGVGVAMENGLDELKQAADYITVSNSQSGVAAAIKQLVLNEVE